MLITTQSSVRNNTHHFLKEAFAKEVMFEGKNWYLSPEPYILSPIEKKEITHIGQACYSFYKAQDQLYYKSKHQESILRNKHFTTPWVAEYLDRGKPKEWIEHSSQKKHRGSIPNIIRPDLLKTEDGWALTELDSVPGGIGLTAFLNELYGGGADYFLDQFWHSLQVLVPKCLNPVLGIIISDESQTYRPEFEWITKRFLEKNKKAFCLHPDAIIACQEGVFIKETGIKLDLIYRFFELFDWKNISCLEGLLQAQAHHQVVISPPCKPHQEEKLNLALFHHPLLVEYWQATIPYPEYQILKKIIPCSWILDWVNLPPGAFWEGPWNKKITDWMELAQFSQKERNLILKISGFDERAWGARGVTLGSDVNQIQWQEALAKAKNESQTHMYVLQAYKKPIILTHPMYKEDGSIQIMEGRLRLCPYYACNEKAAYYLGSLATICPKDKKIIHGMQDAILVPGL